MSVSSRAIPMIWVYVFRESPRCSGRVTRKPQTDHYRFFIQGFAEHRQMQLMVEAGLTPMQVIQAFSKGASETLRIDKDFGTLLRGKAADLLVLDRNPLDNITNVRGIIAVYLGGRKFE